MESYPVSDSLKTFFEPKSVAVIGASRTPEKAGYNIVENLLRLGYRGDIYPVNPEAKKIPAIAMTAKAMMEDVERGERAGFDDYLVKPARAAEILKSIELVKR